MLVAKLNYCSFYHMLDFDEISLDAMPEHIDSSKLEHVLQGLNPEQQEAVQATEGPLLVLAGAGTGKTRVLTARIAYILLTQRAFPSQILAVTFTNKAAREMVERISVMVDKASEGLWLGTFHAIAARILRRHADKAGLRDNFTIIDTDDQIRLLKQILIEHNVDEKKWSAKALLSIIQRWKDRGLTPDKITAAESSNFAFGKATQFYKEYQSRLLSLNAVDFGDLLLHNISIFTQHPEILGEYHRRFRYVLVDEYQDTNVAQYLWLRLLTNTSKNICCVGDDDQSIYSWRGAEVENILRFEKDFPNATIIRLECNYRSTAHILGAASHLIAHNTSRHGKTLWTEAKEGSKIKISSLWDEREEARYVGGEIEMLHRTQDHSYNQIAILVRAGYQTRAFEECFMVMGIPYKVIGGLRFYERREIRDVIAYIRATVQPYDDLAFERIINVPKRGIGASTMQQLFETSRNRTIPLIHAAKALLEEGVIKGKTGAALEELTKSLTRWAEQFTQLPHVEVVERILDESGYRTMWKEDKSLESDGRLENLRELLRALEEFETIGEFLEHVSLVSDTDQLNSDSMVNIMTLHGAKGLEFDTVFLPGWEEGLFPHQKSVDEQGIAGLEEERRLAYVGLTRARKQSYISFAANRRVYNQWQSSIPSRFVDELPKEHIQSYRMSTGIDYNKQKTPAENKDFQRYNRYEREERPAYDEPFNKISFPKPTRHLEQRGGTTSTTNAFKPADKVIHEKFGKGHVLNVKGNQLEIFFEGGGVKTIMNNFVKKEV